MILRDFLLFLLAPPFHDNLHGIRAGLDYRCLSGIFYYYSVAGVFSGIGTLTGGAGEINPDRFDLEFPNESIRIIFHLILLLTQGR